MNPGDAVITNDPIQLLGGELPAGRRLRIVSVFRSPFGVTQLNLADHYGRLVVSALPADRVSLPSPIDDLFSI